MTKGNNSLKEVFDIEGREMPPGSWWWWFWLFFIKNPENPERSKQLMILWSTKNEDRIDCNDKKIEIEDIENKLNMDGAVAAWYFDGEEMHHNLLLEGCKLDINEDRLKTNTNPKTEFMIGENQVIVKIGEDFKFKSKLRNNHEFESLDSYEKKFLGDRGYSMMRMNRMDLKGEIKGKPISGSSYFQRVFVNTPTVPWFWGIFHFQNGGSLSYFNPHFLGKSVKEDISFYDGKNFHKFNVIDVGRIEGKPPKFRVSGAEDGKKIKFTVSPYSKSSWTFRKRMLKIIPNKLIYNEYPSKITDLEFLDSSDTKITLKDLGKSVGNAEYTTGFLS